MSQLLAEDHDPLRAQHRYTNLYTDLLRTVRELGLLRRRRGYYFIRIGLVVAAFIGVWVGFGLLGNSWLQLLMAGALALVLTQVAFLSHDSAHRQIFDLGARQDNSRVRAIVVQETACEAERLHLRVQTPAAPQIHRDEFQSPLSSY